MCLILNSEVCWSEEFERQQTLSEEELAKWIPKNRRNLPAAERALYQKSKPLFTSREGNRSRYKADGWNKEGKVTYLKYLKALRELFAAKEFYDSLLVAWEQYLEDHKGDLGKQYSKKKAAVPVEEDEAEKDEEYDQLQSKLSVMPWNEDFVGDLPWKKKSATRNLIGGYR